MKTNIILLILASALLSSCGVKYYSIATPTTKSADYHILEVSDSNIRIIPFKYGKELTPEVIREYSRVIPIDSISRLVKITGRGDFILGGALGGAAAGAI